MKPNLKVNIGGIEMKNPVMPASGTFGFGKEMAQLIDLSRLGAIVTKSITLEPREGNPQPRTYEVIGGMINTIGLANPGVKAFISEKMPFLKSLGIPVIVSIAGKTRGEYKELVRRLAQVEGIAAFEINISCPNVKQGGMAFGQDPGIAFELVAEIRDQTKLPLIAKLTPNVTDIKAIAQAVVDAGADALSLINTIKSRAIIHSGPDKGKTIIGGLSGPCIKPRALELVAEVVEVNLGVPIIGIGGIMNWRDALDFIMTGATAVQVGTANFVNPKTCEEIIDGLGQYLIEHRFNDVNDLVGKVKIPR